MSDVQTVGRSRMDLFGSRWLLTQGLSENASNVDWTSASSLILILFFFFVVHLHFPMQVVALTVLVSTVALG